MAEQQSLPVESNLPQTPNQPGSVFDVRDGITVESNTGTTDELSKGLDALDKAIDTHAEQVEKGEVPPPSRESSTGRFVSKSENKRHSARARMEDATAKEAAAKRERDTVTAENARLKAELAARSAPPQPPSPPQPPQARVPQVEPEPDPNTYPAGEYDPRYLRDIGKYEARQEFQRQRAVEQQQQQAEHHMRTVEQGMTTYATKMQAAFPEEGALDTFLKEMPPALLNLRPSAVQQMIAPQAPLTAANVIADVISDSELPVQLMKHFKDHPKDFQRLSTLHPVQAFREMGKLEATLAAASPTRSAPRETSRARPPVQRVESVPQMSDAPPGDDASDEEHAAFYNRKEKQRRFGRG